MSVTFRPALDSTGRPLLRCACPEDIDVAIEDPCAACRAEINLCNQRAVELLRWLELPECRLGNPLVGAIRARDLLALCEASAPLAHEDAGTPDERVGDRCTIGGRPAGYLARRVAEIATIAKLASEHWVVWS